MSLGIVHYAGAAGPCRLLVIGGQLSRVLPEEL